MTRFWREKGTHFSPSYATVFDCEARGVRHALMLNRNIVVERAQAPFTDIYEEIKVVRPCVADSVKPGVRGNEFDQAIIDTGDPKPCAGCNGKGTYPSFYGPDILCDKCAGLKEEPDFIQEHFWDDEDTIPNGCVEFEIKVGADGDPHYDLHQNAIDRLPHDQMDKVFKYVDQIAKNIADEVNCVPKEMPKYKVINRHRDIAARETEYTVVGAIDGGECVYAIIDYHGLTQWRSKGAPAVERLKFSRYDRDSFVVTLFEDVSRITLDTWVITWRGVSQIQRGAAAAKRGR